MDDCPTGPHSPHAYMRDTDLYDMIDGFNTRLTRSQHEQVYFESVLESQVPPAIAASARFHLQCVTLSIRNYERVLERCLHHLS